MSSFSKQIDKHGTKKESTYVLNLKLILLVSSANQNNGKHQIQLYVYFQFVGQKILRKGKCPQNRKSKTTNHTHTNYQWNLRIQVREK